MDCYQFKASLRLEAVTVIGLLSTIIMSKYYLQVCLAWRYFCLATITAAIISGSLGMTPLINELQLPPTIWWCRSVSWYVLELRLFWFTVVYPAPTGTLERTTAMHSVQYIHSFSIFFFYTNIFTLTACGAGVCELNFFCNEAHLRRKGQILCQMYVYYYHNLLLSLLSSHIPTSPGPRFFTSPPDAFTLFSLLSRSCQFHLPCNYCSHLIPLTWAFCPSPHLHLISLSATCFIYRPRSFVPLSDCCSCHVVFCHCFELLFSVSCYLTCTISEPACLPVWTFPCLIPVTPWT